MKKRRTKYGNGRQRSEPTKYEEHKALLLLSHLRGEGKASSKVIAGMHADPVIEHFQYSVLHYS